MVGKETIVQYNYGPVVNENLSFSGSRFKKFGTEHNEIDEGHVPEMSKSATGDGRGQEHAAAFCVDSSGYALFDAVC